MRVAHASTTEHPDGRITHGVDVSSYHSAAPGRHGFMTPNLEIAKAMVTVINGCDAYQLKLMISALETEMLEKARILGQEQGNNEEEE